jgi:hypothetical protein
MLLRSEWKRTSITIMEFAELNMRISKTLINGFDMENGHAIAMVTNQNE